MKQKTVAVVGREGRIVVGLLEEFLRGLGCSDPEVLGKRDGTVLIAYTTAQQTEPQALEQNALEQITL